MQSNKKLWVALVLCVTGGFFLLGFLGQEVYPQAPPVPGRVVTESGELLTTGDQILDSQQVWQSIGGQQVSSVWGHGAYQVPDWSADWLHRESMALLDGMSSARHGEPYAELDAAARAVRLSPRRRSAIRSRASS